MIKDTNLPDTCPNCGSGKVRLTVVRERIDNLSPSQETDWVATTQGAVYRCGALLEAHYIDPQHDSRITRQVIDGCPIEEGALKKWSLFLG